MRIGDRSTLLLLITACLFHIVVAKYCDDKDGNARKCEGGSCCTSDETGCCKVGASLWYTWLLIIFFAIFVCVCVGCCRRCYSKQGTNNYSSREITIQSNIGPAEPVSSSSNNYNKTHIDAPPSYFDVAPNYIQEDDMPPPYPGENNT